VKTVLIRTGFKTTCDPAGQAECDIAGKMSIDAVQDVIELLEMIVRRLRGKILQAIDEQVADRAEDLRAAEPVVNPE